MISTRAEVESHCRQKVSSFQTSHVALFVEMKTPFDCMIDKFATVETPVQTSTTSYATEEIIRLNLGKLMRTEESVKLGKEGAFNKKTLHMNLLKWDGITKAKLMAGVMRVGQCRLLKTLQLSYLEVEIRDFDLSES